MRWIEVASKEIGQHEIYGPESNARITEYLRTCYPSGQRDDVPWCAAFVNWVVEQCNIVGTSVPIAKSFLHWGIAIPEFKEGCVVILSRGQESWQGHVGFALAQNEHDIMILGGNQRDSVNVTPFKNQEILGYRWHQDFDLAINQTSLGDPDYGSKL